MKNGDCIKVPKLRPYTPIFNEIIQDDRLRLPVRAVFMLMLSCPPGWDYTVRGMAAIAGVNKDTMSKMLHELEEVGYVRRLPQERVGGRFAKGGWTIVLPSPYLYDEDEPEEPAETAACPKNPDTVEEPRPNLSDTENSDEIININNKLKPLKPPKGAAHSRQHKDGPDWKPERFAKLWAYYPRHENKQGAIRAWDRLKPPDELIDEMARSLRAQMQSEAWHDGIGIPHLSTWLNNARWEDRLPASTADVAGGWAADPEVIRHVG